MKIIGYMEYKQWNNNLKSIEIFFGNKNLTYHFNSLIKIVIMFFKTNIFTSPETETNNEKHTVDFGQGTLELRKILYLSKP